MSSDHYDYVVVGAGASGAVVAARLSEQDGARVLLLEAGPDFERREDVPKHILDGYSLHRMPDFDWCLSAEMTAGRFLPYSRGKVTGGSSSINACLALRGLPSDYDEWAELGCPDWRWDELKHYFKAIENDPLGGPGHGQDGRTSIRRWTESEITPVQRAYYDSCRLAGYRHNHDHNDPTGYGVGPGPANLVGNVRQSTLLTYLLEARQRPELEIRGGCEVERVVFEGTRAVGVEVTRGGVNESIRAGTVVLAGGTIGTPAILQRSGVGPRDLSEELRIPVVAELRGVGANLTDHCQVALETPSLVELSDAEPFWQMILEFTAPGSSDERDMQGLMWQRVETQRLRLLTGLMKPQSRGEVRIVARDGDLPPAIRLNLLAAEEDTRRLREGLRITHQIATRGPLAAVHGDSVSLDDGSELSWKDLGEVLVDNTSADELIRANVRHYVHAVGTCRMGPDGDPFAVTNSLGQVRTVRGLWISDASLMPTIPRQNTNLACIVIGERVAENLLSSAVRAGAG